jgi:hypothetical protein
MYILRVSIAFYFFLSLLHTPPLLITRETSAVEIAIQGSRLVKVITEHLVKWDRKPESQEEELILHFAISDSLDFLRGMDGVRERYQADEDVERFKDIATPIVLAAIEASKQDVVAVVQASAEATGWLEARNSDWGEATNALHAIVAVDHLQFRASENRDGSEWHYELANRALEIVKLTKGKLVRQAPPPSDSEMTETKFGGQAEQPKIPANDLAHSRPLDVHTWSDHPEVNAFVDHIYAHHFKGGNANIRKRHLKVILLDLYVAWTQDPTLKIAYSRNVNQYEPGSRYNALHISKMTPTVIDRLIEAGFVDHVKGFKDRREGGSGWISRMWPTERLVEMFKDAKFGFLDIGGYEARECIILRDSAGDEIEYEDTSETKRMRTVLQDYNSLLRETFIDIPTLEEPFIVSESHDKARAHKLQINQRDKFVRRIFNRGAWDKGGRFWGGWWQRCPKEWRTSIFIDDKATSEVDYSGLHIVMLYAQQKIDYWTEVGEDPYRIDTLPFLDTEDQTRSVAKQLLLTALNAKDDKSAFGAFRQDAQAGSPEKQLKDIQLAYILGNLRERHKPIADSMASDAGIDLMNLDAKITERLIEAFTEQGVPILTIHDSYIVPYGLESELKGQMQKAFEEVMGTPGTKMKDESPRPEAWEPLDYEDAIGFDMKAWEESVRYRFDPPRTDRYLHQMAQFRRYNPTTNWYTEYVDWLELQ